MKTFPANPRVKKRVLVVDDHPLVRKGMMQLIDRQEDLACCGEAETPAALLGIATRLNPDLVLLDLSLGDVDGLELIKVLHEQLPDVPILVLSQSDENLYAERVLRSGARGYIMKQRTTEEVLAGIRAVLQGEISLSREMTVRLMQKAIQSELPARPTVVGTLTDRERHVFQLLGQGLGTRDIARQLQLSFKTIEAHRENIKHKLGIVTAAALVQAARVWIQDERLSPSEDTLDAMSPSSLS